MLPIALGDGFGLLHRGAVTVGCGVVLASPWGIDEIAARKVLFRLATRIAASGIPVLRFDYPGTADAIGQRVDGFGSWVGRARTGGDRLKATCGVETLIFAGLGLGATVALMAAAECDDVAGLMLAAPVVSGRRYLREISLGAPMVEQGLGLDASQRPEGVTIGGIVMPSAVAADLRSIDLMSVEAGPPKPMLVVERASQPQDSALAQRFAEFGWPVERAAFDDYNAAMDNPTIAVMPDATIAAMADWVGTIAPAVVGRMGRSEPARPVKVATSTGTDEALSIGGRLFGVLSQPAEPRTDATVVFLNSGYDHHAGWAYQWAQAARALAAAGIASLRFDMANIGDSPAAAGAPEQVLYGAGQQADIVAAVDMLAARGDGPIVLVGRCSGAYAALNAAAADGRISGTVAINPLRMVWDPDEDVEVAIRIGPRSMADYRKRALNGAIITRILAGEVDVWGAFKGVATQVWRRVAQVLAPLAGSLSKTVRLRRKCHAMFEAIGRRGGVVHMVCSERDASLEQMALYFGSDFSRLKLFPDASLTRVPDADHNMTPQAAQDVVVDVIRETVRRVDQTSRTRTTRPEAGSMRALG